MPDADDKDFDVNFNFDTDNPASSNPDADSDSPTLRRYHQLLWSKPLKSGYVLSLDIPAVRSHGYLIHTAPTGEQTWFGSDAITNSYTSWTRPQALVDSIASLNESQRDRYLNPPYTVGSTMIWPVSSTARPTMNQARGTSSAIADRMDLTLECIRRYYTEVNDSPLADVITSYGAFFDLFAGFEEFVDFFFFQDLVSPDYQSVQFFLPFGDFRRPATPVTVDEYITYGEANLSFIERRAKRMAEWVASATK